MDEQNDEPIELPIDGILDLHTFLPGEVKDLVPEYIQACLDKGVYQLRIIHGKGIGTLQQIVQSILSKHPAVKSYWQEDSAGGWGTTVVDLIHSRGQN